MDARPGSFDGYIHGGDTSFMVKSLVGIAARKMLTKQRIDFNTIVSACLLYKTFAHLEEWAKVLLDENLTTKMSLCRTR